MGPGYKQSVWERCEDPEGDVRVPGGRNPPPRQSRYAAQKPSLQPILTHNPLQALLICLRYDYEDESHS